MSGFWKAMRFTSIMFADRRPGAGRLPVHLGLLLQGLDPRLRRGARRDVRLDGDRRLRRRLPDRDLHLPAVFRVLPGRPCEEAQELIDTGELYHGPPINPATEEEEDTEVGFPGAHHHIAEQSQADGGGDGGARLRRAVRRPDPGPGRRRRRSSASSTRSSPTRRWRRSTPRSAPSGAGWRSAAAISIVGIGTRLLALGRAAASCRRCFRERLRPVYLLCLNKWYFDEADRHPRRPPGAGDRPLRQPHLRALRRRRDRHRHRRTPSAAPAASSASSRAASSAATRCC